MSIKPCAKLTFAEQTTFFNILPSELVGCLASAVRLPLVILHHRPISFIFMHDHGLHFCRILAFCTSSASYIQAALVQMSSEFCSCTNNIKLTSCHFKRSEGDKNCFAAFSSLVAKELCVML